MLASGVRLPAAMLIAACCCGGAAAAGTAPVVRDAGWSESGEASWYGPRHEGLKTTSGERFDSRRMTAAHPSLPMGAYVRVTLKESGRSIVVRVNDREPPHGVRCIDLSKAAAARLGIVTSGVADVTLSRAAPEDATELAEAGPEAAAVEQAGGERVSAPRGRRHRHHAHR